VAVSRDIHLGHTALEHVGDECASNAAMGTSDEGSGTGNIHDTTLLK
jgi:hypothetical protein